jgi:hypothetical protein
MRALVALSRWPSWARSEAKLASWVLQEAKANPTAGLALLGRLIPVSTEGTLDATLIVRHVDETAD